MCYIGDRLISVQQNAWQINSVQNKDTIIVICFARQFINIKHILSIDFLSIGYIMNTPNTFIIGCSFKDNITFNNMSKIEQQNANSKTTPLKSAVLGLNTAAMLSSQTKSQKSQTDHLDNYYCRSSDDERSGEKLKNASQKLSDMLEQGCTGESGKNSHEFQNWEYGKSPKSRHQGDDNYESDKSAEKGIILSAKSTPNKNQQLQQQSSKQKEAIPNQQTKTKESEQQQAQNEEKLEKNMPIAKPSQPTQIPSQILNPSQNPSLNFPNSSQQPSQMPTPSSTSEEKKQRQLQIKYQKQLQDDLSSLKFNFTQKKKSSTQKEKQKQPTKTKQNKTLTTNLPSSATSKHFFLEQTPQITAIQMSMLSNMAHEKKKENYVRLKQWDKRRADSLAIHRVIVETLQSELDKRIKASLENLDVYAGFFREKIKQEERMIAYPVINTKAALQNNSISKNVYINCTVILNTLSDENNEKCKRITNFIELLKTTILRDSIDLHLQQSQKELLRVRERIANLKHSLRKYNAETEEKTNQIVLYFGENSINLRVEHEKDFYCTQLEFLKKAHQQTAIQKKLGECCYEYLQIAISQQVKRNKLLRQSMIIFSRAIEQCYGLEMDKIQLQQLSSNSENQLIEQFYSLEEIFDERNRNVFKNHMNLQTDTKISNEQLRQFINKFDFQPYDTRVLLLKQYNVRYHPASSKQQSCTLVITVDKYLLLFLSREDPHAQPDVMIRATLKSLELRVVREEMVDIVIRDEKRGSMISYFWESKSDKCYRVEFLKKDTRDQFVDYLRKIRG